uniref:non-specific serine/threonine protein kinase n=1 Tax=Cajanus cajan TaxID=3821 RepID=A0A151QMQ5_CAJCA|nr:putative serine/threonine-protein kinase At1g18390 family [Cajanus cajan]
MFEACEPQTCGNGANISYPFHIRGKQNSFCGLADFELTCGNNGFPILNLVDTDYTIQTIFYNNHSLRVSNPVFLQPNASSCFGRTRNLTVAKFRFRLAPNQRQVFLIYGCHLEALPEGLQERRIGCDAGNKTTSVLGLDAKEDQNLRYAMENCEGGMVNAAVEDTNGGITEALGKGLLLIWDATNCSQCIRSGGRCGFDRDMYAFRCYCPDRPHAVRCVTGMYLI